MKLYLLGTMILTASTVFAQPKVLQQAIISTTINVIAPEEDDNPGGTGGGMNFRNIMDGETKSTTWIKNDMSKIVLKSDMGRSTIIRNNSTKITTTLLEIMGTKQGFYVSDSEQVEIRKKADSLMESRRKKDSTAPARQPRSEPTVEVSYADGSKKLAGYDCKKAYVITTRFPDIKDTAIVWYTPEIKLQHPISGGSLGGFGNMVNVSGVDKIDGFVMRCEMNMRRNRRMEIEVTKIDMDKEITDKEFDIPKDFDVKPMKEMQNMFGGRGGFPRPNQ